MALVNGPLFSLGASGQLGKALVFAKWKGRDYVREYVIPANPRTLAQHFQRGAMAAFSKWWAGLSADTGAQESWTAAAAAASISPFNSMVRYNLDRAADNVGPLGAMSDGEAHNGQVDTVTATSPSPGRLQITVAYDTAPDNWDLTLITLGTDGGANTTANTFQRILGGVSNNYAATSANFEFSNLPPGDYFVGANIYGPDGTGATIIYSAAAVTIA